MCDWGEKTEDKMRSVCPKKFQAGGSFACQKSADTLYTVPVTVKTVVPGVIVQIPFAFWAKVAAGTVS